MFAVKFPDRFKSSILACQISCIEVLVRLSSGEYKNTNSTVVCRVAQVFRSSIKSENGQSAKFELYLVLLPCLAASQEVEFERRVVNFSFLIEWVTTKPLRFRLKRL